MGAAFGRDTGSIVPPDLSKPLGLGHAMVAIPINGFIPMHDFTSRIGRYIEQLKAQIKSIKAKSGLSKVELEKYEELTGKIKRIEEANTNLA